MYIFRMKIFHIDSGDVKSDVQLLKNKHKIKTKINFNYNT